MRTGAALGSTASSCMTRAHAFVVVACCWAHLALAQTWTLYARTDGTVLMNAWAAGTGTAEAANYIAPCAAYLHWGDSAVLRVTMGSAVDYFRPNSGLDLCGVCAGADKRSFKTP
jgi:hypothetical protein